jgi:hypothetical protein
MADRPVFVPTETGNKLVEEVFVHFTWHPGLAPSQKKKNVVELHHAAKRIGLAPLLEISSKSEKEAGQRLSAFRLKIELAAGTTTVECAFQGSKVFENGGPFQDLYWKDSRDAKRDSRLQESGKLIGFNFEGKEFPLTPTTAFYDWLYFNALYPHREWLTRAQQYAGFTDIEFNPQRSLNCQARSFATFMALQKREVLEQICSSFDQFRSLLQASTI